MTKWGILVVVFAFVVTIFADWGARMTGWSHAPYAIKVEGEEITFDQVDRLENSRAEGRGEMSDTDRVKLYTQVVDDLIAEQLGLAQAARMGLGATNQEVVEQTRDRLFRDERGQFDPGRYQRARRDIPSAEWAQYERMFRNDITLWKIYNFVASGVVIPPGELRDYFNVRYQRAGLRHILIRPGDFVTAEEARAYYESHGDSFLVKERVRGRHVLFPVDANTPADQKMAAFSRAEAVRIRLQAGESFDKIYREALADTSQTVLAQDLDWFGRGDMVPEFDSVAFTWPTRRATEIIETRFGYHVAYFDAHEMPHRQAYADVEDAVRARLSGESQALEAKRLAEDLGRRIAAGESFEDLARRYSSGRSRDRGGWMGDVIPGEMTPELYPDSGSLERIGRELGTLGQQGRVFIDPSITKLIFDLEVNKVSDVVASNHGFHIVRIERRREADPEIWEEQHEQVQREYADLLKNQLYRDWIASIRKNASIKMSDYIKRRIEI